MAFKQTYNLVIRGIDRATGPLGKAARAVDKFGRRIQGLTNLVTTLAFGIVPVVRSMSRMVSSSLKLGDTIAKTSAAIGLSTTTLQEYHHAAELAGVGANRFNSAVKGFAKRLGELQATGGKRGTLAEYLRDGNEELLRMLVGVKDADQGLDVFLNAIDKTGSQLQKAGLAAAGFGRQAGVDMTVLLRDGIGALRETREEAHDLGVVMSQSTTSIAERAT